LDRSAREVRERMVCRGLVVGEGSFFIAKTKFHGRSTQYPAHVPIVYAGRRDHGVCGSSIQGTGDSLSTGITDQGKMAKRPCYHIFVNGHKRVLRVLDKLEPYLMGAKAHSASLVSMFIEERANLDEYSVFRRSVHHREVTTWRFPENLAASGRRRTGGGSGRSGGAASAPRSGGRGESSQREFAVALADRGRSAASPTSTASADLRTQGAPAAGTG